MAKKKKNKIYGPVFAIFIIIIIISLLSLIFSILNIEGYKNVIANNTLESQLITVRNIISIDGIKYLFENIVNNFMNFKPLVLFIVFLLGLGICEQSGLMHAIVSPFKKIKFNFIIFITLFIGIISTFIGDLSYIILIPLTGVIYKYLEKNPIIGILTMFIGITIGYGTGLIFNYNDHLIGLLTQNSATLNVDPNYKYSLLSNLYIMWFSTILFSYIGTIIINKFLVTKLSKKYQLEEQFEVNEKAKKTSLIIFLISLILVIYFILPINLPLAGILLDSGSERYIDKLFGSSSPFGNGLVVIISLIFTLSGFVYGKKSGNIKTGHDFSLGLSKSFENLGFLFVLMFFTSQIPAIIEWTNLGNVIATRLIDLIGNLHLSGILLLIIFIIITVIISILIPDTMSKWNLMSPTIVPLFMQANITPNFTNFVFKIADSIGKCFSPVFIYFIVTLAFLEKYNETENEKKQISFFGTYKLMLPSITVLSLIWILIIVFWYLIGFPIGIGNYSTL